MVSLSIGILRLPAFDFGSLTNEEMNTLNKITNNEYMKKPMAFKYGNFKLSDFFHSLLSDEG